MTLRWLRAGAQIVLMGGAVLFLVKTAREHAGTFSAFDQLPNVDGLFSDG